jgi:hypothetical protein
MEAAHWAQALQDSGFAAAIRGGTLVYPVINVLHVLGVALLVGSIVALDFRLLGFSKNVSAEGASNLLTPFAVAGLVIALPTGVALFASDAVSMAGSRLMTIKLVLVALGIGNALLFRRLWKRELADWDRAAPPLGRAQSAFSIAIWLTVPVLGRLVAYL